MLRVRKRALRILRVALLRPLSRRSPRRLWVLALALPLIVAWQLRFEQISESLTKTPYRNTAAVGLKGLEPLVYFYHYLGLYPVASTLPSLTYSREGAEKILKERGDTLVMEVGHQILGPLRIGDHARILLYLPHAWTKPEPKSLVVWRTNVGAFIFALCAVFVAFWWRGWPVLGALLVLFVGSNPYQLYETYHHDNIFGWSITLLLLLLALYLPVIDPRGPRSRALFALPVIAGVVLGTFHHIRSEPVLLLLSCLAATALMTRATFRRRAWLAATLIAVFAVTSAGWTSYFRRLIRHTHEVVKAAGGRPHPGALAPEIHHNFWMAVWDGLGDHDTKYGYVWDDRKAHAYVQKVLRDRHGIEFPPWDGDYVFKGSYLDEKRTYVRVPFQMPHYHEVLRGKVLSDITSDPLWYAGILARRVWVGLTELTPVKVKVGKRYLLNLHTTGFLAVPVIALALWARRRSWVGPLLLFSLPLSLPGLLIYSKGGMTYVACYHLFAAAVIGHVLLTNAGWAARRLPLPYRRRNSVGVTPVLLRNTRAK